MTLWCMECGPRTHEQVHGIDPRCTDCWGEAYESSAVDRLLAERDAKIERLRGVIEAREEIVRDRQGRLNEERQRAEAAEREVEEASDLLAKNGAPPTRRSRLRDQVETLLGINRIIARSFAEKEAEVKELREKLERIRYAGEAHRRNLHDKGP